MAPNLVVSIKSVVPSTNMLDRYQSFFTIQHFSHLFGVVVELGVGETDAGAVQGDPRAPLHPHHQGTHGEHHALEKSHQRLTRRHGELFAIG